MVKQSSADVAVVGLVGERNREVRGFIEHELGPEGMARSVLVVATSDRPAPLRVRACFVSLAIAEYFRDQGKDVLLVIDSVTRLAMAQREIGLACGEPPARAHLEMARPEATGRGPGNSGRRRSRVKLARVGSPPTGV